MGCKKCNDATTVIERVAYVRVGTKELGYASVGIIGCNAHVKLVLDRLGFYEENKDRMI